MKACPYRKHHEFEEGVCRVCYAKNEEITAPYPTLSPSSPLGLALEELPAEMHSWTPGQVIHWITTGEKP